MEGVRHSLLNLAANEKNLSFERVFDECENRIHAIFIFLNMLELVQQQFLKLMVGEGRNNFIIEYNEDRPADAPVNFKTDFPDAPPTEEPDATEDLSLLN